mmetsp:Transcript_31691/g.90965  ORF Transcript_31691/g.90965 Transcript_31691/m.90965 type:complete len:352 (+) Transcript_31691:1545-2600(+)
MSFFQRCSFLRRWSHLRLMESLRSKGIMGPGPRGTWLPRGTASSCASSFASAWSSASESSASTEWLRMSSKVRSFCLEMLSTYSKTIFLMVCSSGKGCLIRSAAWIRPVCVVGQDLRRFSGVLMSSSLSSRDSIFVFTMSRCFLGMGASRSLAAKRSLETRETRIGMMSPSRSRKPFVKAAAVIWQRPSCEEYILKSCLKEECSLSSPVGSLGYRSWRRRRPSSWDCARPLTVSSPPHLATTRTRAAFRGWSSFCCFHFTAFSCTFLSSPLNRSFMASTGISSSRFCSSCLSAASDFSSSLLPEADSSERDASRAASCSRSSLTALSMWPLSVSISSGVLSFTSASSPSSK